MSQILKMITVIACAVFGMHGQIDRPSDKRDTRAPCSDRNYSNSELRQCYATAQLRIDSEVDAQSKQIASDFRRGSRDKEYGHGPIADSLRKAGAEILQSQNAWKASRDYLCNAVSDSYTTGSGAGTAYEKCMYEIGRSRQRELETVFK